MCSSGRHRSAEIDAEDMIDALSTQKLLGGVSWRVRRRSRATDGVLIGLSALADGSPRRGQRSTSTR